MSDQKADALLEKLRRAVTRLVPCDGECVRPTTTRFRQEWRYFHPRVRTVPFLVLHDGSQCLHGTELGAQLIRGEVAP